MDRLKSYKNAAIEPTTAKTTTTTTTTTIPATLSGDSPISILAKNLSSLETKVIQLADKLSELTYVTNSLQRELVMMMIKAK